MSGLFSTIRSDSTALSAQSTAMNIASNNLSNVNNQNYANQVVSFSELPSVQTPTGPISMGIGVSVQSTRSDVLDQLVQQQTSITSAASQEQAILQQAQAAMGESLTANSTSGSTSTTSTSGLGTALSNFFASFQTFASSPNDPGAKQGVVAQSSILANTFNQISTNIQQVVSSANSQIVSGVSQVNTLLKQIAALNTQVKELNSAAPNSAAGMIDQRQAAIMKLAALVPITVSGSSQDELTLSTNTSTGSVTLVDQGNVVNTLSYTPQVNASDSTQTLPTAGYFSAVSTANPSTSSKISAAAGTLGGLLSSLSGPILTLQLDVDSIAQQLVTKVNTAYGPSGASGTNLIFKQIPTGDLNIPGKAASEMSVDSGFTSTSASAKANGNPDGDNSIARTIANLENTANFTTSSGDNYNGTVSQVYSNIVSGIGLALDTANTNVTSETAVQTALKNQQQAIEGVSIDTEMANMMTYQKAFQASSEVLQVVNEMLKTLISTVVA
jgi:flagellar hook-associated protein 1